MLSFVLAAAILGSPGNRGGCSSCSSGGCANGSCGGGQQVTWLQPQPFSPVDPVEASINSLPPAKGRLAEVTGVHIDTGGSWVTFKGDNRPYVINDKTKLRLDGKDSDIGTIEGEWNAAKINNETKYFKAAGDGSDLGGKFILRSLEFYYQKPNPFPVPDTGPPKPPATTAGKKGQGCPDCEHCECGCENGGECKCKIPGAAWPDPITQNMGLDLSKMKRHDKFEYTIHDGNTLRPASQKQAFQALTGDGSVPDDSKSLRLSVIGSAEECKAIEADVASNAAFADLKGSFTFQSYRPDNAMVADIGAAPGKPAVYLQAPDGKVLQRWEAYAGPVETAGALRKKKPDYDPKKDPNGSDPGLFDLFNLHLKFPKFKIGDNPLMLIACCVGAMLVWKKL